MRKWTWDDFPDVLQVADVVRITGASARTVRKLFEGGEIPAVKVGQKWLAAKENVQAYLRGELNAPEKGDAA